MLSWSIAGCLAHAPNDMYGGAQNATFYGLPEYSENISLWVILIFCHSGQVEWCLSSTASNIPDGFNSQKFSAHSNAIDPQLAF